jgi:hypothetical protein
MGAVGLMDALYGGQQALLSSGPGILSHVEGSGP